jgi:membrane protein DedA with SNARE-associated domain/rhodanese-related sulfurtransferase
MVMAEIVEHHGYMVTMAVLFLSAVGMPVPTSVVLLMAGAAAHHGSLHLALLIPAAAIAASAGDTVLYTGGRLTGWWLLGWLCRVSVNPENCIFGSANYFYRRGPKTLLFAKFIPGLASMAPPLAGSLNMRPARFLRLDFLGALFYTSTWITAGYLLSPFIRDVIAWVQNAGHFVFWCFLGIALAYGGWLLAASIRDRRFRKIERIPAPLLHELMQQQHPDRLLIIADVRSHGYYDPGMQRIKNSIRVEPSRLKEELIALREFMVPDCDIYLYCSCAREATSVRVAHLLQQENCHTKVIQGGLKAWVKAGGPLEPVPDSDVEHLPRFD